MRSGEIGGCGWRGGHDKLHVEWDWASILHANEGETLRVVLTEGWMKIGEVQLLT